MGPLTRRPIYLARLLAAYSLCVQICGRDNMVYALSLQPLNIHMGFVKTYSVPGLRREGGCKFGLRPLNLARHPLFLRLPPAILIARVV